MRVHPVIYVLVISLFIWMAVIFATNKTVKGAEVVDQQPGFGKFDVHSKRYLERQQRRWRQLCKGGGRYQAMAEAYEMGKPSPCK